MSKIAIAANYFEMYFNCNACSKTEQQLLFEKNCEKKRHRLALKDVSNHSNISFVSTSTPSCKADIANQAYNSLRYAFYIHIF